MEGGRFSVGSYKMLLTCGPEDLRCYSVRALHEKLGLSPDRLPN